MDTLLSKHSRTETQRATLAESLNYALANTVILTLMNHRFRWNVGDSLHHNLHKLFSKHYQAMEESIDAIAERIRSIGAQAALTVGEVLELSSIPEVRGSLTPDEMVKHAIDSHNACADKFEETATLAAKMNETITADLLKEQASMHKRFSFTLQNFEK